MWYAQQRLTFWMRIEHWTARQAFQARLALIKAEDRYYATLVAERCSK